MSRLPRDRFFRTSLDSKETLVDNDYSDSSRIPSPRKANTSFANTRGLIPLCPSPKKDIRWPGSTLELCPEVPIHSPLRINPAFPKTPERVPGPLSCSTNVPRRLTSATENKLPETLSDRTPYTTPVDQKSEVVAAKARELIGDMSTASHIIINHSPPKRRFRSLSNGKLDDAAFACELGIERYREGFGRRAMLSEPSPMRVAVDAPGTEYLPRTLDVADLKREIMNELRSEMKKELKAEIEMELKWEIKEEIMEEIVKEHTGLQDVTDGEDDRTIQGDKPAAVQDDLAQEQSHIQDIIKGLRDMSVSDGEEEDMEEDFEMEEPIDPTDPALAFFLSWKRPKDFSASSSIYSQ